MEDQSTDPALYSPITHESPGDVECWGLVSFGAQQWHALHSDIRVEVHAGATAAAQSDRIGECIDAGAVSPSVDPDNDNVLLDLDIPAVGGGFRAESSPTGSDVSLVFHYAGLDPNNDGEDLSTPQGLGNVAAKLVVQNRIDNGFKMFGTETNGYPFADASGYMPLNTAYELSRSSRWQPLLRPALHGNYAIQTHVTPQAANAANAANAHTRIQPSRVSLPRSH